MTAIKKSTPGHWCDRDTDNTARDYLTQAAAEQDAVSEWAAANPSKHTSTPAEREPQTDLKSVDWLLGFAFLAFLGLSATGLYWLAKALGMVISWMVAR